MTFANKISHPLRKDSRLARAGAGDHQHRPLNVFDSSLLMFVGEDLSPRQDGTIQVRSH
jgi:hypothetical protein